MSMNVGGGGGDDGDAETMIDINTTPLIDVMLVLLIMLIITIPLQTHTVKLDMPVATPPTQDAPPPSVEVDIDFDGQTTWNGEIVNGRGDLEARIRGAVAQDPQPEFQIKTNKLAAYRNFVTVAASAQRLGIKKLGVIGNEQFIE